MDTPREDLTAQPTWLEPASTVTGFMDRVVSDTGRTFRLAVLLAILLGSVSVLLVFAINNVRSAWPLLTLLTLGAISVSSTLTAILFTRSRRRWYTEHQAPKDATETTPPDELEQLRETIDVLSDSDLMQDIRDGLADLKAGRTVPASDIEADLRKRSTR